MKKYRIVEILSNDYANRVILQKRYCLFFWRTLTWDEVYFYDENINSKEKFCLWDVNDVKDLIVKLKEKDNYKKIKHYV